MKSPISDSRLPICGGSAWPVASPGTSAGQPPEFRLQDSKFKGLRSRVSVTQRRCCLKAAFRARPERRLQPAGVGVTDAFNHTRFKVRASHRNLRPNL